MHGGLGSAPKFPRSLELDFLFHYYHFSGEAPVLEKLGFTLEKMARGGIYDQLGGGFHRYSVDAAWVVPHFEKMLYDNALLPPLYLAHYRLTGSDLSRRIAAGDPGFYPAGDERPGGGLLCRLGCGQRRGGRQVLRLEPGGSGAGGGARGRGPGDWRPWDVTPAGNFEGANILTRPLSRAELASAVSADAGAGGANPGDGVGPSQPGAGPAGAAPPGRKGHRRLEWPGHHGPGPGGPGPGGAALW